MSTVIFLWIGGIFYIFSFKWKLNLCSIGIISTLETCQIYKITLSYCIISSCHLDCHKEPFISTLAQVNMKSDEVMVLAVYREIVLRQFVCLWILGAKSSQFRNYNTTLH